MMIKKHKKLLAKRLLLLVSGVSLITLFSPLFIPKNNITIANNFLLDTTNRSVTSSIEIKANLPDISNIFAGQVFTEFSASNNSQFYQDQIFNTFLEIVNPVDGVNASKSMK